MSCEFCTDPDGESCFPIYGVGPHKCYWKIHGAVMGESEPLPKEEWPDNYQETEPGMGIYWCPHCGDGKPLRPQHANPPADAVPCGTHNDNDGLDEFRGKP